MELKFINKLDSAIFTRFNPSHEPVSGKLITWRLLLLSVLLVATCFNASAVKPNVFSSPSTIERMLAKEKAPEFKAFKKAIKKRYSRIKDVAIERWKDGNIYYVLYCSKNDFALMRASDSIPIFSSERLHTFQHLELESFKGYPMFKVDDSEYYFANAKFAHAFNPQKDVKKYGNKEYVINGKNPTWVYALDGTPLMMAHNIIEFRDTVPAGLSHDESTGLSIYHPALPPRFLGMDNYRDNASYVLGYFKLPHSQDFKIKVPGGEYFISRELDQKFVIKSEFREDLKGNIHEYKVFEVGARDKVDGGYGIYHMSLCLHGGTTGIPIIKYKNPTYIKISTPDQIVYYSVYDSEAEMYRTGCVSLIDSTFKVEPRFADVNVFYNSENKPYALVRLSSLREFEVYNPAESYDFASMTPLEIAYEQEYRDKVVSEVKSKIKEDFQEKYLMAWFKVEIQQLRWYIRLWEDVLQRIVTNTLYDFERKELQEVADGTAELEYPNGYSFVHHPLEIENFLEELAKKDSSDKADNYRILASYVRDLRNRFDQLYYTDLYEAKKEYIKNLKNSRLQMELAKQQQMIDLMNARQANEAHRQAVMLKVLNMISGLITHSNYTSGTTVSSVPSTLGTGQSMLDKTYVSPEIMGAAISSGWTPENSTTVHGTTKSSTSHSTNSRICHGCYGTGKCPHCHGAGRYAPNLNGHIVDCTACNKTGVCHLCKGTGHH